MSYKIIVKPKSFMKDYIAVHGGLPKNELPERMRQMHHNTIYIRDDIVKNNPARAKRIEQHELREIRLMKKGYKYKTAHRKAGY
jgi:hypothetical protein